MFVLDILGREGSLELWAFLYSSLSWRITILQVKATEALEVECHCHTAASSHVCWWPGRRFPKKSEILAQSPPQDSSPREPPDLPYKPKGRMAGSGTGRALWEKGMLPALGPRIASPAWLNLATL